MVLAFLFVNLSLLFQDERGASWSCCATRMGLIFFRQSTLFVSLVGRVASHVIFTVHWPCNMNKHCLHLAFASIGWCV